MIKNGLFIVSLGLLMFMFSANQATRNYNIVGMLASFGMIILGTVMLVRGNQQAKKEKAEQTAIEKDKKEEE
ncbi:hypothetical protein [Enterococcus timonensis]|uniref:hypothetical protein n=1 Tax=Enterococcus timonensis TaxID=1852364 RepID=UPI0008DABAB9|nr:hypothetical protein [Enterococcus timonensis]